MFPFPTEDKSLILLGVRGFCVQCERCLSADPLWQGARRVNQSLLISTMNKTTTDVVDLQVGRTSGVCAQGPLMELFFFYLLVSDFILYFYTYFYTLYCSVQMGSLNNKMKCLQMHERRGKKRITHEKTFSRMN